MEIINEVELRRILKARLTPQDMLDKVLRRVMDTSLSWEEKRPFWFFLFNTGRDRTVIEAMKQGLEGKHRVPFDILIELCARANLQPSGSVMESLWKGLKKQRAFDDILSAKGWDKWEKRIDLARRELLEKKVGEQKQFKENLQDKFLFLQNQRMTEQAGRVLRRMVEIFPDDVEFQELKRVFDEQWAREVLAGHIATLQAEHIERTKTQPSAADEQMLSTFLVEGEKIAIDHRDFALDLAVAFWFLEDYNRALEILEWAPTTRAADWMRAELMFEARRFVEALEQINQLEVKYIEDPETTFSVNYLRAQCLHALGQKATAMEIMQSIVRVRTGYRSAHALILEWTEGVSWE